MEAFKKTGNRFILTKGDKTPPPKKNKKNNNDKKKIFDPISCFYHEKNRKSFCFYLLWTTDIRFHRKYQRYIGERTKYKLI